MDLNKLGENDARGGTTHLLRVRQLLKGRPDCLAGRLEVIARLRRLHRLQRRHQVVIVVGLHGLQKDVTLSLSC